VKREIILANQGNQTVTEYFTKLKTLWDELGGCLELPNCKCTKEFNLIKHFEGDRVHQVLMGLDTERFGTIRSNLLAIEPLPSLNRVYAAVLREERQQTMAKGMENQTTMEASAFKVVSMNRAKLPNRLRCTHCQKLGHEQSQCYELIAYPPNWQNCRSNQQHKSIIRSGAGARNHIGARTDEAGRFREGKKIWSADSLGSQGEAFTVTYHVRARTAGEGYEQLVDLNTT